jgi:hypothetical protein
LVAAVAVGTAYVANDVYGNWVVSPSYSGYNVGLKNAVNHHLDFEVGVGVYKARNTDRESSGIFRVDYPYANRSTNTTFDVNTVYNFLGRAREFGGGSFTFSPYVGLGFSVMTDDDDYFGVGGIVGFSAGVWQNRVQLHARYKWITDYEHTNSADDPFRLASQFEIGLSVKYKYGWGFRKQIFDDYDYNSDRSIRFGLHVGFNTAAKNYGYKRYEGFYGYNLMVYMMGRLDDSWALNWGMIGINSRGFGYIPMSLNVSREFQFKPLPEWISLVPFAGIQWGFTSKLERMFNIGPSVGGAVRVNQMFDIGAHYDYGVLNMSKYGEHYLRDLQVYTRVYF